MKSRMNYLKKLYKGTLAEVEREKKVARERREKRGISATTKSKSLRTTKSMGLV